MEVLSELKLGDFKVRINHTLLLNGILRVCGVPKNRLEAVHMALARLGKEDDWAAVRSILCENHGLEAEVTLHSFVECKKLPLYRLGVFGSLRGAYCPLLQGYQFVGVCYNIQ